MQIRLIDEIEDVDSLEGIMTSQSIRQGLISSPAQAHQKTGQLWEASLVLEINQAQIIRNHVTLKDQPLGRPRLVSQKVHLHVQDGIRYLALLILPLVTRSLRQVTTQACERYDGLNVEYKQYDVTKLRDN